MFNDAFCYQILIVRLRMLQSGCCVFAVICNKVSAQMPKKHLADIKTDNTTKACSNTEETLKTNKSKKLSVGDKIPNHKPNI